jgi:hypothetical protein
MQDLLKKPMLLSTLTILASVVTCIRNAKIMLSSPQAFEICSASTVMLAIQTQLHNLHSVGMRATPLEQCLQSAQIIKFHHGKDRA